MPSVTTTLAWPSSLRCILVMVNTLSTRFPSASVSPSAKRRSGESRRKARTNSMNASRPRTPSGARGPKKTMSGARISSAGDGRLRSGDQSSDGPGAGSLQGLNPCRSPIPMGPHGLASSIRRSPVHSSARGRQRKMTATWYSVTSPVSGWSWKFEAMRPLAPSSAPSPSSIRHATAPCRIEGSADGPM
jgi:hypothetical protein